MSWILMADSQKIVSKIVYFSREFTHKLINITLSGPWNSNMPLSFEDIARDFMAGTVHSNSNSIVGEVMNLDDFLEELSDPDPKSSLQHEGESNYHQDDDCSRLECVKLGNESIKAQDLVFRASY